jgi:hypothetical protein
VEKLGGKLETKWFCFGDYDLVAVLDMPDNVSAAAFSLAASAGGAGSLLGAGVGLLHDLPARSPVLLDKFWQPHPTFEGLWRISPNARAACSRPVGRLSTM